jgi:regulation of enolase protein 1 (concanavalin A-like superfamily)
MDVGSGWVSPQAFWNIQENKVRAGTITGSGGVIYTDAGRSDVRVECDITFWNGGVNSQQGLLIRGIDTNNYIFCRYVYADNSLRISKNVGGGQSDVTSKNYPIPLGTTKRIAVEAVGSTIKVYADSVLELTGTTSDLNTGAKCGLWVFEAGTNNTVWDNFLVLLPSN